MNILDNLLAEGRDGRTLGQSRTIATAKLDAAQVQAAFAHVKDHPDARSYLLLFALADADPLTFSAVPAAARAAIICDALRRLPFVNDFGHLVSGLRLGEASEALIAIGPPALPHLIALLCDQRPAPFFGSADATLAAQYRRCDFAFRIAMQILGKPAPFDADVTRRDTRILALSRRLQAAGQDAHGTP